MKITIRLKRKEKKKSLNKMNGKIISLLFGLIQFFFFFKVHSVKVKRKEKHNRGVNLFH